MIWVVDPRRAIAARLDPLPPATRIVAAAGTADLDDGSYIGVISRATLIRCLSGRARYRHAVDGRSVDTVLARDEILAIAPGTSLAVRPQERYRSLLIAVAPDHLQAHITVNPRRRGRDEPYYELDKDGRVVLAEVPPPVLQRAMQALIERARTAAGDDRAALALADAVAHLAADMLAHPAPLDGGAARRRYSAARAWVDEHFAAEIDRGDVAAAVGVDPAHVSRLFRRFGDCGFSDYLWRLRLDQARRLLADPRLGVAEVARRCGCPDANYFARRFRSAFGVAPSAWR